MKLKVALCDDNSSVIKIISGAIADSFEANGIQAEVFAYSSYEELDKALGKEEFPLYFLDICTPTRDGIEFAKRIRKIQPLADIIFISSKEERVFDTFSVEAFAFVRKSNFLADITNVILRYSGKRKEENSQKEFSLLSHGLRINVSSKDIRYIEGKGNYQKVCFANKDKEPLEISSKREALEKDLSAFGFIRIHKGFLVNFFYIKSIDGDSTVTLKDGKVLPVSRRKTAEVKKSFLELCDKNGVLCF